MPLERPAVESGRGLFAGGSWLPPSDTFTDLDPTTGRAIGQVAAAGTADVDRVVEVAARAAREWRAVPAEERGAAMQAFGAAIRDRREELARLDAMDSGNPLRACLFDLDSAARMLHHLGGLALMVRGETIPTSIGALNLTLRDPFGVVARIIAFNHPALFMARAVAGPVIAGNTVIVKPSPLTPLSAIRLAEIADGVFPPGVVNLVTGGAEPAAALARHPQVRRIALTGSVAAGLAVTRAAAERHVKVVTLELGGKNPMIVMQDADVEAIADAAIAGMNFTSSCGQSCGSTSRLFVHQSLYRPVVEAVAARVEALRLGDPLDERTEVGPLVSEAQRSKVERYVAAATEDGARLVAGGGRPGEPGLADGFFYRPTFFADVRLDHRLAREEVFGPLLAALPWTDEEAVLEAANSVDYGLTAAIWTNDLERAVRFAKDIEAGYVWINGSSYHPLGTPFGGFKDSGTGREESFEELLSYTQVKNVNIAYPPRRAG